MSLDSVQVFNQVVPVIRRSDKILMRKRSVLLKNLFIDTCAEF